VARHRPVGEELRRVLARLGGVPATHAVEAAHAGTHPVALPAAAAASSVPAVGATAGAVPAPGAAVAVLRPPTPRTTALRAAVRPAATPGRVATALPAPAARTGRGAVVRTHAVAPAPARAGVRPVRPCGAAARAVVVALAGRAAVRAERPLPAGRAHRREALPGGPLFTVRRRRADWASLDRHRLAVAWGRMLADHGLPGDLLNLVGLYGPVPLGLLRGVALEPDGRVAMRLGRARSAGPPGDVVLARHTGDGRLLRVDVPRAAAGPGGGRDRRVWN
jgi:hypothetical protein